MGKVALKTVRTVNMVVFGLVGLLHLWRAVTSKSLTIGTTGLPVWLSYLAVVLLGVLVWLNYQAE